MRVKSDHNDSAFLRDDDIRQCILVSPTDAPLRIRVETGPKLRAFLYPLLHGMVQQKVKVQELVIDHRNSTRYRKDRRWLDWRRPWLDDEQVKTIQRLASTDEGVQRLMMATDVHQPTRKLELTYNARTQDWVVETRGLSAHTLAPLFRHCVVGEMHMDFQGHYMLADTMVDVYRWLLERNSKKANTRVVVLGVFPSNRLNFKPIVRLWRSLHVLPDTWWSTLTHLELGACLLPYRPKLLEEWAKQLPKLKTLAFLVDQPLMHPDLAVWHDLESLDVRQYATPQEKEWPNPIDSETLRAICNNNPKLERLVLNLDTTHITALDVVRLPRATHLMLDVSVRFIDMKDLVHLRRQCPRLETLYLRVRESDQRHVLDSRVDWTISNARLQEALERLFYQLPVDFDFSDATVYDTLYPKIVINSQNDWPVEENPRPLWDWPQLLGSTLSESELEEWMASVRVQQQLTRPTATSAEPLQSYAALEQEPMVQKKDFPALWQPSHPLISHVSETSTLRIDFQALQEQAQKWQATHPTHIDAKTLETWADEITEQEIEKQTAYVQHRSRMQFDRMKAQSQGEWWCSDTDSLALRQRHVQLILSSLKNRSPLTLTWKSTPKVVNPCQVTRWTLSFPFPDQEHIHVLVTIPNPKACLLSQWQSIQTRIQTLLIRSGWKTVHVHLEETD